MTSHKLTIKERIEDSIISKKDCWFTRYCPNSKKPMIQVEGKPYLLTRVVYKIYNGEDPGELLVCHTCDNPRCINPDHLWLGTCADNMKDKKDKNRQTKGSTVPTSKLTEDEVIEIRNLLIEGELTLEQIKDRFNVGIRAISEINSGKRWNHVEGVGTRIRGKRANTLNVEQVERIKRLLSNNMSCLEISGLFNVSRRAIQDIKNGKTWNLLEGKDPTKLNAQKVGEIKELLSNRMSHSEVGRLFGVSRKAIDDIKNGKTWNRLN